MALVRATLAGALDEGIFFLEEKSSGLLAATAMANRVCPGEEEQGAELGWVGAGLAFRGRHLGAVVCQAVQARYKREGVTRAYLRTDDFRLPAIKTYWALGWRPVIGTPDMRQRWEIVCKKLGLVLP